MPVNVGVVDVPQFGPDSALRRLMFDVPGLLGGGATLLQQIAHPAVAAGVDQHSDFRTSTIPRLVSTLDLVVTILYGTPAQAQAAAASVHAVHDKVHGKLSTGESYDARNRDTQTWVWATLVKNTFDLADRFVRELSRDEAEAVYEDWKTFGRIFGIGHALLPGSLADFDAYYEATLAKDLCVDDTTRRLAEFIISPWDALPWWLPVPKRQARAQELMTVGLLPSSLREQYGIPFGESEQQKFSRVSQSVRKQWAMPDGVPRTLRGRLGQSVRHALPRAYVANKRLYGGAKSLLSRL